MACRGTDSMTDTDLVTILLGTGVEGCPVRKVARSVIRRLSVLVSEIQEAQETSAIRDRTAFLDIEGVGEVKSMQLVCALELGRRIYGNIEHEGTIIRSRKDVIRIFQYLRRRKQEHVIVVALNARNEVVGKRTVAIGSLNKSVVEARDVFSWVLQQHAAGMILVHNHPSGDTSPSDEDRRFTDRMKKAADLLGVDMVDHVIV